MDKQVYLYELDSVRTSKKEILAGQQALFREIALRGNRVVITYNQLADSPTFLQILCFEKNYDHLLRLFANGSLKISRYIDRARPGNPETRTAAQYILHALNKALGDEKDDAKSFIFSGLPIQSDSALLTAIRDAICYSDLARITDLIQIRKDISQKDRWEELGIHGLKKEDLECIYRYVKLILQISQEPLSHISAKPADQKVMRFTEYLEKMLCQHIADLAQERATLAPHYADAVQLLRQLQAIISISEQQSRSPWLKKLHNMDSTMPAVPMAEAIINLCYNYTVEDSIQGIEKRYADPGEEFAADYLDRLSQFWQEHQKKDPASDGQNSTVPTICIEELPDWSLAVNVTDEAKKLEDMKPRRDEDSNSLWQRRSRRGLIRKILGTLLYVPLFFIVEQAIGLLETLFPLPENGNLWLMLLSALFTTFGFGMLSSLISNWITLPDISDTVKNIGAGIGDLLALRKAQKEGDDAK